MGTQYTLTFLNNSANDWTACVYQTDPSLQARTNAMSLAWFAKAAAKQTSVDFMWTIDYSFVWAETGILIPGVVFKASQNWAADPASNNKVDFTQLMSGAFTFANPTTAQPSGSLLIHQDNVIPAATASVGIGMSNAGTFAVTAQPNIDLIFTPHPQYWITFGSYQKGQVLDTPQMTEAANVAFPANVYAMTAILGPTYQWTIMPTSQVNARYVAQIGAAERSGDRDALNYVEWGKVTQGNPGRS